MVVVPRCLDMLAAHKIEMKKEIRHLDPLAIRKASLRIQFKVHCAPVLAQSPTLGDGSRVRRLY